MANFFLPPTPSTPFLELPEVPRKSSKRLLSDILEDPSRPEKRRKALALLVETRTVKSLKLADSDKTAFPSEPIAESCFPVSSGTCSRLLLFPFVLAYFWQGITDQYFFLILCRFRFAIFILSFLWLPDEEHPYSLWV